MNKIINSIKGLWVGFIVFPLLSIIIGLETLWDLVWESRIRNKQK